MRYGFSTGGTNLRQINAAPASSTTNWPKMSGFSHFSNLTRVFLLETVPALNAAQFHLIDVPLIYRKNHAGLRTTGAIDKTSSLFFQHGTGEEQVTAGTALVAFAFADRKLAMNIFLSEMNDPKTP